MVSAHLVLPINESEVLTQWRKVILFFRRYNLLSRDGKGPKFDLGKLCTSHSSSKYQKKTKKSLKKQSSEL